MRFRTLFLVTASSAEGIPSYRAFLVSPSFSASTLKAVFPLPGDANDGGKVTVTDIGVIVDMILGNTAANSNSSNSCNPW